MTSSIVVVMPGEQALQSEGETPFSSIPFYYWLNRWTIIDCFDWSSTLHSFLKLTKVIQATHHPYMRPSLHVCGHDALIQLNVGVPLHILLQSGTDVAS